MICRLMPMHQFTETGNLDDLTTILLDKAGSSWCVAQQRTSGVEHVYRYKTQSMALPLPCLALVGAHIWTDHEQCSFVWACWLFPLCPHDETAYDRMLSGWWRKEAGMHIWSAIQAVTSKMMITLVLTSPHPGAEVLYLWLVFAWGFVWLPKWMDKLTSQLPAVARSVVCQYVFFVMSWWYHLCWCLTAPVWQCLLHAAVLQMLCCLVCLAKQDHLQSTDSDHSCGYLLEAALYEPAPSFVSCCLLNVHELPKGWLALWWFCRPVMANCSKWRLVAGHCCPYSCGRGPEVWTQPAVEVC